MKSQTEIVTRPGANHTGVTLNPSAAVEMVEGTAEFKPTSRGGPDLISENRVRVAKKSDPVATMPPTPDLPATLLPVLDKLGARLAYERAGTRLYDALLSKHDAYGSFPGGPSRADLEHIRNEEHQHMLLVTQMIVQLGGDPTVVTPCANLQAVASRGVQDVLVDPRTTLVECLDAILVAELTDHESWDQLAAAIAVIGDPEIERLVRRAEKTEAEHLVKVRGWIAAAQKLVAKPRD